MIHLYHVTKIHASGAEVLQNAYFSLAPGDWVWVTGEGRAGKSTLLKLLCGEEKATWGKVQVEGRDPALLSPAERSQWLARVGLIFPDLGLLPGRTLEENLLLPLLLRGDAPSSHLSRAQALMEAAGLAGKGRYLPHELSQSEQRMAAALRALLPTPKLLLADEPFQGLSPRSSETLQKLFMDLHGSGATLVVAAAEARWATPAPRVEVVRLFDGKILPGVSRTGVAP